MTDNTHLTPEQKEAVAEYKRHQEKQRRQDRGIKSRVKNSQENLGKPPSDGVAAGTEFDWNWGDEQPL